MAAFSFVAVQPRLEIMQNAQYALTLDSIRLRSMMAYPLLSDLIRDLTGAQLPLPVPMFGLLVAAALLTAIWVTESELRRMYAVGRIGPGYPRVKSKGGVVTNVPTPPHELVSGLGIVMAFFGVIGARISTSWNTRRCSRPIPGA